MLSVNITARLSPLILASWTRFILQSQPSVAVRHYGRNYVQPLVCDEYFSKWQGRSR